MSAARRVKPGIAKGRRLPPVWFMTDPARTPDPAGIAANLPRGWGVIFRTFGAEDRLATGRKLARVCRRKGLTFLVAGDPGLARQLRADGVHWPERMLTLKRRRSFSTVSAHARAGLAKAQGAGVDAAIFSTVFDSKSRSAGRPIGALKFRAMVRAARLPVYALGGVSAVTAARLFAPNGKTAAGWAAVDAIVDAFG